MKLDKNKLNLKAFASVLILGFLIFSVGCSLWPFGKDDSVSRTQKLKSESDAIYNSVQGNSKKFDEFLKTLDKTIYSAKDLQNFSNTLSTLTTQLSQDENNLKSLASKLSSLSALDKDGKYKDFINAKTGAAEELNKAIIKSKNIALALSPKMVIVSKLFTNVDKLKKTQSDYIVAMLTLSKREQMATLTKNLIIASSVVTTTTPATTTPTTDTTTTTTPTDTTSSTTSSTSADLQPWVYQISKSEWPSSFSKDFAEKTSEELNALYTDFYIINKELKFNNTKKITDNLAQIKADNADLAASIGSLITNLRDLTRYTKDKEKDVAKYNYYQNSHNSYRKTLSSKPAGVSSESVAAQGIRYGHEVSHNKVLAYKSKIRVLNEKIKASNALITVTLKSDYKEAQWRFLGSLNSLYKINNSISKDLTGETKSWKDKAITKYVYQRLEHLAEAKHKNYQANKLYVQAKEKVASR